MSSPKFSILTIVSLIVCVNSTEEIRFLDDGLNSTQEIETANPSDIKLTASLDIKLTGKCESSDPNIFTLIGCNNAHNVGDNNNEILMEQFRIINEKLANLANAIRDTNLEVVKIKERSHDAENGNEKETVGFKTTVGVYYKYSSVKNAKLIRKNQSKQVYPKSCKELFDNGNNVSGIYKIQPKISKKPIVVLCDMQIRGGGWTTIQKRFDGSQDFLLGWRDYKFGFGDVDAEFWIGLENIYAMTVQDGTELLVEVEDRDGARAYAHYTSFKVGAEKEGYPLSILNGYSGDAGDALTYHLGMKFTTIDFDQDQHPSNCAVLCSGAWWYKGCHISNLNGKFINLHLPGEYELKGLQWAGFRPSVYSYAKSRMLIKTT